ncbi:hypothetical protein CDAR_440501 [Caerostris darwini]|uniref:Uncharacterized protein n=1 Tax=Caerostris darwini TaxID=1538125 RepID=A0AAV4S345_9ARAC|nr:hypothetical protein CDAR_440501 [Caerostris darwini]
MNELRPLIAVLQQPRNSHCFTSGIYLRREQPPLSPNVAITGTISHSPITIAVDTNYPNHFFVDLDMENMTAMQDFEYSRCSENPE